MHSKEVTAEQAVGRVLDELVKDCRRRQEIIRKSEARLLDGHRDDSRYRELVRVEAAGTRDGLEWAIDRINDLRREQLRTNERRRDSTLVEHTETVDLP